MDQRPWHATDVAPPAIQREVLHDVCIRPIRPDDLELERRFVEGLSRTTRYQRLLSGRNLLPGELERWTNIDPVREIALIAVAEIDGVEQQLGVARCVRDAADPLTCDFALVVGDRWQHHGLGESLLRELIRAAAAAGVRAFSGITLSDNRPMLKLARKLGCTTRLEPGDATVTRLDLALPVQFA